ncbi:hypothetical protein VTH06DRAFT_4573 [Thermothelomyces fergusii]|jgi:hypothetical protein
MSRA